MMKFIFVVLEVSIVKIFLFIEWCFVGFLLLVLDYIEFELDLNEYCIYWCYFIYFVRVIGNLMIDIGFYFGDLLVVDKVE